MRKTVGLDPTAQMFAIRQVISDLLSLSIFICAVKLITPTRNSCYTVDKLHLSGGSRDDVRAQGTAAIMLSIDCLCSTLLPTAAGNSWSVSGNDQSRMGPDDTGRSRGQINK